MEFTTPKNFKNGKYIMNRFRLSDLLILLGGIAGTVVLFFIVLTLIITMRINPFFLFLTLVPLIISALLTLIPATIKHNTLEVLKIRTAFKKRTKFLIWEGVNHFEQSKD